MKLSEGMKMRNMWVKAAALMLVAALSGNAWSQEKATYAQQVFVMLKLRSTAKTIGVISSTATEQFVQAVTRAGAGQGVTIVVGKAASAREVPALYKKLVIEKGATMIWLPDEQDQMITDIAFDFLRESTVADKIGLCVPTQKLVTAGALCSVMHEGKEVQVYVNQRVAQAVGITVTNEAESAIKYFLK